MRHPYRILPPALPPALARALPVAVAVVACLAVLGLASGDARADFYRCQVGARTWVTNQVPKGLAKHCRVAMKTAKKREVADEGGSGGGAAAAGQRHREETVRPRVPRTGAPADLPNDRLFRIVLEAAERYHLPPAFVLAVIKVESNFHPRAVSRVGAQGLMQLMPGTAESLGVTDAFDPRQNIMGGCKYLRILANRFDGDLVRTIAGYHAGGGAVAKKEGVPYAATEQYVRWVLDRYYEYKGRIDLSSL